VATVYLALGSNLGDRTQYIHDAVRLLNEHGIKTIQLSTLIETDPVGGPRQGLFMNAVLQGETFLPPQELLSVCLAVETSLGRVRTVKNGPRTIDIDILLYGDVVMNTPDLVIPHPRMKERDFVMRPLRELIQGNAVV
jgi:2-amino-4-hydroxy-6-hydroxymethyldihydropteridine diphosphokinase